MTLFRWHLKLKVKTLHIWQMFLPPKLSALPNFVRGLGVRTLRKSQQDLHGLFYPAILSYFFPFVETRLRGSCVGSAVE